MEAVTVRIVGATDAWQKAADTARLRLTRAFGPAVEVVYYTASAPEINAFPQALALIRLGNPPLPLVFIGDELISMGGKIQIPELRQRLEALGVRPAASVVEK